MKRYLSMPTLEKIYPQGFDLSWRQRWEETTIRDRRGGFGCTLTLEELEEKHPEAFVG